MNTPADEDDSDLRYAEYALGVLDAGERARVALEVQTSDAAATQVAQWQRRLLPLGEEIAAAEPPPLVWVRLRGALGLDTPAREAASSRPSLWNSLRFWHWLSLGTGALAAVCLVLLMTVLQRPGPVTPYMAATITQTDGHVGWTATLDVRQARMIVVPATPQAFAAGRAPELWLIPRGHKPVPVGMIAANAPTTLKLDRTLLTQLGASATLAVSVEPPGGSPTGQPTGPVIAAGAVGAAG